MTAPARAAALFGPFAVAVGPVERFEWVYDRHTRVLWIDHSADAATAVAEAIAALTPVSPKFTVIDGGAA